MRDKTLILVLGDQLSHELASLKACDMAQSVVLMAEVAEEADYVWHHKKKLAFVFSAMRHFAQELQAKGWDVRYQKLDDPSNAGSLVSEVGKLLSEGGFERVVMTEAARCV